MADNSEAEMTPPRGVKTERTVSTESIDSVSRKENISSMLESIPEILQVTNLYFKESDSQISQAKPTVRCTEEVQMQDVIKHIICNQWILHKPQIVAFVVSNARPNNNWTNAKQIKSFQKGLMKAVENTNMWLIVNGLDVGTTTVIGDAVTNFISEAKYKRQASTEKTYAKFNFIGIVDQKEVKYSQRIIEKDKMKIEIWPDKGNEHLHGLNQSLTHYILIQEKSSTAGINKFLSNLVKYLNNHQSMDTATRNEKIEMLSKSPFNARSEITSENSMLGKSQKGFADQVIVAKQKQKEADSEISLALFNYLQDSEIPIVSIVINGGLGCAKLIKEQIAEKVPIVVLKGSGGLADLLAFVDIEIRDRSMDSWDVEFVESYIKPELTIRILGSFKDLQNNSLLCNQFRQIILDIVRDSRDTRSGQNYLTIINMLDVNHCDLENLTEHLLLALFRSQRTGAAADARPELKTETKPGVTEEVKSEIVPIRPKPHSIKMILKDLKLCIDWNCPDMAKREVLSKHTHFNLNSKEARKLFEECLIRQNRCKFVDLFLSQKFRLRSYTPQRLRKIFRAIHFNKFYVNVCWEGILRRSKEEIETFIYEDKQASSMKPINTRRKPTLASWNMYFNDLVDGCIGIKDFFDPDEVGRFTMEQWFPLSEREAERKCLELLVLWALFDNRRDLVRIFWYHSDQPIQLGIVIAIAYQRLSWYVNEEILTYRLKEESQLFVSFACELLDIVYKDSPYRAEEVLNESIKDYNYKTSVDMAAIGKFKQFFSHVSVQRWLTLLMNGSIEIISTKHGVFHLPHMIKLIMSAYFIFPMYFWIKPLGFESDFDKNQERLLLEEEENDSDIAQVPSQPVPSVKDQAPPQIASSSDSLRKPETPIEIRLHEKNQVKKWSPSKGRSISSLVWWTTAIYEVWSAPVTKFWNFQFFYTFYLALFSLATLYPKCGHFYLDVVITLWTTSIIVDNIRQTYLTGRRDSTTSFYFKVVQVTLQLSFVGYFIRWRLWENSSDNWDAYMVKVFMCVALVHAYYVLLTVFLPISATLGPLLYRLKIMIFVDFFNFIRLSILVMICFGIAIQALFYPDADVDGPIFRQMFYRTFFSLFITPKDELEGERAADYKDCANKRWTKEQIHALTQREEFCSASDYNFYNGTNCPNNGIAVHIFFICYFILLKLVLLTLLYAIFSSSAARLTADTDSIWRYQRYGLVMDFVTRAPLPPPLNLFYYFYWILRFLCAFITDIICRKDKDCIKIRKLFRQFYYGSDHQPKTLADDDYAYLRILAAEVFERFEGRVDNETLNVQQFDRIQGNSTELENQRKSLRQLKSELCEMKRSVRILHASMESIKHFYDKSAMDSITRKSLHILSRHSPYPNTYVHRYPVPDKYVPWDVMFMEYEPAAYTKPKEEFSTELEGFVDPDLLAAQIEEMRGKTVVKSKFEWNRLSSAAETIDRRSWDEFNGEPLIYKLKDEIPLNHWGRTGLIGRGSLPKWGPNHYLMVVITRTNEDEQKPTLEILVEQINSKKELYSLINCFIPGELTYKGIEALFKVDEDEFKDWRNFENPNDPNNKTSDLKMVKYFESFDTVQETKTDSGVDQSVLPNLKYERLMRGYFDDPLNTDQAWKEVELWHFHYTKQPNVLNDHTSENLHWKTVKESLFYKLALSHSQVIQTIVDKLRIDIR